MDRRKYGTCFFEQYAQISLSALLGSEFDSLVNRDRPDLQSLDGHTLGIEVTRAMEESARAAKEMLKDVSGYTYGLREDERFGRQELDYWSMALPLRRILESKVAKVGNDFYGRFDKMGLYVFCKDPLSELDAYLTLHHTMGLQKYLDNRYNRLYLSEVHNLYVCNLDEGLQDSSRLIVLPITPEQRKTFYMEAIRRQL
ncbi:MAG: hypothetical protein IJ636_06875 [Bacteroidales bacterium]|nr:hypothetical protein [Bacteroidales bacterium]